jgi:phospholipid/cholesterol/gamma-HCH transport system substrate-binding protein
MALTANKYRLGVFFSASIVVFLVIIVWLGGGFREKYTDTYVCYFSWSVQGLNEGSNVMYNGVPIGRISSIDIAPDGRLVEVLMEIRSDFTVDSQIVAIMQLTGITGLSVINLSPDTTIHVTPHYDFDVLYPVIPVAEGALQSAASILTRMTEIINEVDFVKISKESIQLLENINEVVNSDMIENIELAILSNSANLDTLLVTYIRLGENVDRLVLTLNTMAPDLAVDVSILVEELQGLSEPLKVLVQKLDEVLVESTNMFDNLSAFFEALRNDPAGLFIQTTGEGVWQ